MNINEISNKIDDGVRQKNGLSNDNLVQLLELIGGYLNLKTIPDYATENGMTYNGARKQIKSGSREVRTIFNVKFVIDNE